MGQKQKDAARIAELEAQLALADEEIRQWDERQARTARDLRTTRADLNAYKAEEDRQRRIAERKKREEDRAAERARLDDLSNGIVDLNKIATTEMSFDYDAETEGGTVTITLHASEREAKILNAYATRDRRDPAPVIDEPAGIFDAAFNNVHEVWSKYLEEVLHR